MGGFRLVVAPGERGSPLAGLSFPVFYPGIPFHCPRLRSGRSSWVWLCHLNDCFGGIIADEGNGFTICQLLNPNRGFVFQAWGCRSAAKATPGHWLWISSNAEGVVSMPGCPSRLDATPIGVARVVRCFPGVATAHFARLRQPRAEVRNTVGVGIRNRFPPDKPFKWRHGEEQSVGQTHSHGLTTGTSGGKCFVFLVARVSPWEMAVAASRESMTQRLFSFPSRQV